MIVATQKLTTKGENFMSVELIKSFVYLLKSSLLCHMFLSKLGIISYLFLCAQCRNVLQQRKPYSAKFLLCMITLF